jgi:hypothetical protein
MQSPAVLDHPGAATIARCGGVAQLVEHATENRGVAGSSPALAMRGSYEVDYGLFAPANGFLERFIRVHFDYGLSDGGVFM